VLDVRSPGEYQHAHIPGAYSFPLFTDEERKIVGTTYKQVSRESAIREGLDFFGPRMRTYIDQAEAILASRLVVPAEQAGPSKTLLVHCWRGGMRSAAIAWLLDLYGFKVYSLVGGYKKYRHWVIDTYSSPVPLAILGGFTGSGKTYVLQQLSLTGQPILDLEALASHKGSAFGNIGMPQQPSQEHFENLLAHSLNRLGIQPGTVYTGSSIIIEDESQRIGLVNIPQVFWNLMRSSPVFFLEIPFEERLNHIIEYGQLNRTALREAILRIQKRLGGLETKTAVTALDEGDMASCFRILLTYYDKWYRKGLHNREGLEQLLHQLPCEGVNAEANARKVLEALKR
jgi:tRNA 2-selenouridine synthase